SVPGLWKKALGMALSPDQPLFLRWQYFPRFLPWALRFLAQGSQARVAENAAALAPIITDAVDQHLALAEGTPAAAFIRRGPYVFLYRDRAAFEKDALGWALRRTHEIPFETWDRARMEAEMPGIAPEFGFAAAQLDHGWVRDPGGYVAALFAHFSAAGGRFLQAEMRGLTPSEGGGATLHLSDGSTHTAPRLVVAAGVWAARIAADLGHAPRLEAERGYHLFLRGAAEAPPFPLMIADAKAAVTPMAAGLRVGGVAEYAGIDGPEAEAPRRLIERAARRLYPDLPWEAAESWMGRRPTTIDSLPLLGESPAAPGIVFATGGQHLGLTMGARLGRLAAGIVTAQPPNIDITPYRMDRFAR
ncbi:MAG: FAD-binding oxidoreductase, partial [Pseudomonadota bacterium]